MKLNLGSKPLQGHPAEPWGWQCHPSGCGRQNIDPKWIILEPWYQMKFVLLGFGLTWDLSLFFFLFLLLTFGMRMLSYGCTMIIFGKQIMYLVSEVHSLRGIFHRKNCTLSHIYICFWWCVDEISDLKADPEWVKTSGAIGMEWMNVACEKDKSLGGQRWNAIDLTLVSPKIHMWKSDPQCNGIRK